MLRFAIPALLAVSACWAQQADTFQPATTNVWGAEYPRVDSAGRAEIRLKAPDATQVKLNFWSGPKIDLAKQPDGTWSVTTPPLVPGLHYYTLSVDGVDVSDPNSQAFFGGGRYASAMEIPEAGSTYYSITAVPHGQVRSMRPTSSTFSTNLRALITSGRRGGAI